MWITSKKNISEDKKIFYLTVNCEMKNYILSRSKHALISKRIPNKVNRGLAKQKLE